MSPSKLWGSNGKENSKGDKYNNLAFCLPSVTASAAGEEVKHVLCFKPLVIILFSMGHISFVPKNFQMVKNSLSFCLSSFLDEMYYAFSNVKLERIQFWP